MGSRDQQGSQLSSVIWAHREDWAPSVFPRVTPEACCGELSSRHFRGCLWEGAEGVYLLSLLPFCSSLFSFLRHLYLCLVGCTRKPGELGGSSAQPLPSRVMSNKSHVLSGLSVFMSYMRQYQADSGLSIQILLINSCHVQTGS